MSDERLFNVKELAELVGGRVVGDESVTVGRVAGLENADSNEVAYVEDSKHFTTARESRASCLVVPENSDFASHAPSEGRATILVARPKLAFARIAAALASSEAARTEGSRNGDSRWQRECRAHRFDWPQRGNRREHNSGLRDSN